ncbi:MAG: hypothetical protein JRD89_00035 [Deltaproteobacteria bacterium]|nr:hypothetical protein [Deltaproteobacteria bacterium]
MPAKIGAIDFININDPFEGGKRIQLPLRTISAVDKELFSHFSAEERASLIAEAAWDAAARDAPLAVCDYIYSRHPNIVRKVDECRNLIAAQAQHLRGNQIAKHVLEHYVGSLADLLNWTAKHITCGEPPFDIEAFIAFARETCHYIQGLIANIEHELACFEAHEPRSRREELQATKRLLTRMLGEVNRAATIYLRIAKSINELIQQILPQIYSRVYMELRHICEETTEEELAQ